jgi:hypothetical protein
MLPNGEISVKAARTSGDIANVFGMLKQPGGRCLSIEEMNEAIADAWAGKR